MMLRLIYTREWLEFIGRTVDIECRDDGALQHT